MSREHSPGPGGAWWVDDRPTPWVITFRYQRAASGLPVYHHVQELGDGVDLYVPAGNSITPRVPPGRSVIVDV